MAKKQLITAKLKKKEEEEEEEIEVVNPKELGRRVKGEALKKRVVKKKPADGNVVEKKNSKRNLNRKASVHSLQDTKQFIHSNLAIVKNAIRHSCLAGGVNRKKREEVMDLLSKEKKGHFVIHLKKVGGLLKYAGVYRLSLTGQSCDLLHSVLKRPRGHIEHTRLKSIFKYDSGSKSFREMKSQTFSPTTDAILLRGRFDVDESSMQKLAKQDQKALMKARSKIEMEKKKLRMKEEEDAIEEGLLAEEDERRKERRAIRLKKIRQLEKQSLVIAKLIETIKDGGIRRMAEVSEDSNNGRPKTPRSARRPESSAGSERRSPTRSKSHSRPQSRPQTRPRHKHHHHHHHHKRSGDRESRHHKKEKGSEKEEEKEEDETEALAVPVVQKEPKSPVSPSRVAFADNVMDITNPRMFRATPGPLSPRLPSADVGSGTLDYGDDGFEDSDPNPDEDDAVSLAPSTLYSTTVVHDLQAYEVESDEEDVVEVILHTADFGALNLNGDDSSDIEKDLEAYRCEEEEEEEGSGNESSDEHDEDEEDEEELAELKAEEEIRSRQTSVYEDTTTTTATEPQTDTDLDGTRLTAASSSVAVTSDVSDRLAKYKSELTNAFGGMREALNKFDS